MSTDPTQASSSGGLRPRELVLDGRFRIVQRLGAGGMGEVYLAEQVSLNRRVALKVLRRDLSAHPGMAERFRREALLLSSVEHPAVVRVIDFGQHGDASCLVMELAEGQSLETALSDGAFSPPRALTVIRQLAEGLAAIHEKGIVHRDLKPDNVVLTQTSRGEQAKLLDFGIARLAEATDEAPHLTQEGSVLGTPKYISPEQATGGAVDARSDIYSLGVVAYRVLSGRLPFRGPSAREYFFQHATASPEPLGLDGDIGRFVMQCLAKRPDERPASAADLARVVAHLEVAESPALAQGGSLPPQARSATSAVTRATTPLVRLLESVHGSVRALASAALVGAVAVAAMAIWLWPSSPEARARRLLEDGRADAALAMIETAAKDGPTAERRQIRMAALHLLDRHHEELDALDADSLELLASEPLALRALVEDFGKDDNDQRLREALQKVSGSRLESALRRMAAKGPSSARWGAARYLDVNGVADRGELTRWYRELLNAESCEVKGASARRLGQLGDTASVAALEALAKEPRKPGFLFVQHNCGQNEATEALRRLSAKN